MSVYDTVTNRIVEELERGTVPWVKPWKTTLPYNAVSEKAYSGVNILLLWSLPHTQPAWLTYKQARGFGGYVKKGEKATPILYASTYKKKAVDPSGEEAETRDPVSQMVLRLQYRAVRRIAGETVPKASADHG